MRRIADPVLMALLALSLCANVYLYRYHDHAQYARVGALRIGDRVPPLDGELTTGGRIRLNFDGRPVVLYIFSSTCGWCERNLENARTLAEGVATRYEFVALALGDEDVAEYLRERHLTWRVARVAPEVQRAFRLGPTPQTLVIGPGGRVLHVWTGAYTGTTAESVEQTLGVTLPGMIPVQPTELAEGQGP